MKGSFFPGTWVQNSDEKDYFPQELSDFINVKKVKPTFPKVWEKLGLNQFFGHKTSILVGLFLLLSFFLPFGVEGAKPTEGSGNSIAKFPGGVLVNAGGFENSYYVGISEIKKGADHNVITSGVKIPFKATSAKAIYNIRTSYREGQTLLTTPDCTTPPDQDFGNYEDLNYFSTATYECIIYSSSNGEVGIGNSVGQAISASPLFSGSAVVMYGNSGGGYASFGSVSSLNNFKIVSFDADFFGHSNGQCSESYNIIGYDDGVEIVSVEGFEVKFSGTYGIGNAAIDYIRADFDQDGSNTGTLTFGSAWSNLDEIRFFPEDSEPNDNYYIALDNINFEPAVQESESPSVTTNAATSLSAVGATLNGNVTADGGASVTARGFVYSSSDNTPTIGESGVTNVSDGSGVGVFSEAVTGLSSTTTYYYQAYATNSEGTSYGGVESFTTEAPATLYAGGSGTELDPYQISNWRHLHNVRENLSSHFVLNNDLDETSSGYETFASSTANSGAGWLPIEFEESGFSGIFDGGSHVIKGLNINRTSDVWTVGLFATLNEGAVVKNLGIIDATVVGGGNVGILVGYAYAGQIEKVYSSGSVSSTSGYVRVGGLVGTFGSGAVILRSSSTASVSGTTPTGNTIVGGLVGSCSGSIFNSYSLGSVFGSALSNNYVIVGGLVGYAGNAIENSYSVGAVSGTVGTGSLYRGGLIGFFSEGSVISSYYDGQTSGQSDTGKGDPKTTAEMKTQSTFINWDFVNETANGTEDIWKLSSTENNGYPSHSLNAQPEPPIVTDENISISGATGTGGAFKIGDTVTATWNNTAGGDNNSGITGVTVNFSQFGGGSAVVATNSSGTWTATYTISAGAIDAGNRNVSVTATNADESTTTDDTSNATVDNIAPVVSNASIGISGGTGTGGAFKIGDTVTATWDNSAFGDDNSDIVTEVTVDFSQFGGGAAVAATNNSDTWTATYTITAIGDDTSNRNVSVTATDNAGNKTTTADTTNATLENDPTTVSSVGVPANGVYIAGQNLDFTVNTSQNITVNSGGGTPRIALTVGSTTRYASYISGSGTSALTFRYTVQSGDLDTDGIAIAGEIEANGGTMKDGSGNDLVTTLNSVGSTVSVLVDAVAPNAPTNLNLTAGSDSGSSSTDDITNDNTPTITGQAEANATITLYDTDGTTVLGTTTSNGSGNWLMTSSALSDGAHSLTAKATDAAGNQSVASTALVVTIDTSPPVVTDANISISGATGTGGAFKIGDTVTATWNNTAGGDHNSDVMSSVTVDFSQFGGGAGVAATNSSGTWTATYTISAGAIDAVNRNISVTATDIAGNTTTTGDTSNATVDNVAPTVTDANISISGATGTGGTFKIGDTVTATWDNSAFGDDNSDTVTGVTFDFSQFGGGSAVLATNSSGTWTATYTITAGAIDASNRNVSVTAADNAGNATTTADTSNATVDNIAPVVSEFAPVNNATGVALQPTLIITFDDEVTLGNTGIFSLGKVDGDGCSITSILEFDLSDPDERSLFTLSDDKLTVSLILTENLPVNTQVILAIPTGFVTDLVGNSFVGFSAYTYTWSFTTINKLNQTITFPEIETKTYGDPTFTLGNAETDQGLTVTYTATDPTVVSITGNQATILKVGSTTITATQDGDEVTFAAEAVEQTLTVNKKGLTITADNDSKTYGATYTFAGTEFTTDGLANDDEVTSVTLTSTGAAAAAEVNTYDILISEAEGTGLSNYEITYVKGTLTVGKKAVTITANDDSKTYGETYTFSGTEFTVDGLEDGDEVTSVTLTSTGAAAAAEVNTYDILISEAEGTGLSNYEITYVKGTLTVGKKAVTITANDDSKTYGETYTFAGTEFTVEGLEDGDEVTSVTLTSTGAPAAAEVNTYDILISEAEGTGLSNYEITYVKGTLTVDKKALTITADDKQKAYGEANPVLTFTYTGLVNGDTKVTTDPSISTTATQSSNVGSYPITLSGGSDDNYTITLVNGTLTIGKKDLTITADDKQKTYGEANPALTFSYTGLVNGDTKVTTEPSISTTALASSNVGSYPITLSGGSDDNYTITLVNGTLTIGKKALTITADDKQKTYGEANPALTFSYTGLTNGDTKVTTEPSISTTGTQSSNVGTYPITLSGGSDDNYTITLVSGTLTIGKKDLTIRADDKQKTYGEANPNLTFTYTGLVNGDTKVTTEPSISTTALASSNAGTYPITLEGGSDDNYTITLVSGTLTIGKKDLTITADDKQKTYGDANPALTFSYTGLVNGDTKVTTEPSISTTAMASSNAGTYPITLTGGEDQNYTITLVSGTLTIGKKDLTITADDKQKTYGEANPALTFSYTGLVNGDTKVTTEPSISTTATQSSNVGSYPITLSGGSDENYTITLVNGTLTIGKKDLTITADDKQKTYGEANPALTFSYTGLTNGDTKVTTEPSISTTGTQSSNVGTYPITLSGGSDDNYTITLVSGTLTIGKKDLTITADDKQKTYGDANPALTFSYTGLVNGDTKVTTEPSISTTATQSSNVGTYPITLAGGSDENYEITLVNGTLTINKATLKIEANPQTKIFGAADPALTFVATGFKGTDNLSVLTGNLVRAAGEQVGKYAIGLGTLTATNNYLIEFTSAQFEIIPAELIAISNPDPITTPWSVSPTLPAKVTAVTADGQVVQLSVSWNLAPLNLFKRGTYFLTGVVTLPDGILNPEGLRAMLEVRVLAKPAPQDVILSNDDFDPDPKNYFQVIGNFTVIDPIDNVHTITLVPGAGDNQYFEVKNGILFWSSAEEVAGRTQFTVVIRVTDRDGNVIEKSFTINRGRTDILELEVFNSFTPNGDGINDTWGVPDLRYFRGVRVQVFDRNGERLFYTEDADTRWDGTYKGKEMPVGTYFWIIEVIETGNVRRGILTILKN